MMTLQTEELATLIHKNQNLTLSEKERLINLMKYRDSLTLMEYEFRLTDENPVMSYSRVIPFAVRPVIRKQIYQIIKDDIFEISDSPYINPVTVVHREGKEPRLCIDAHRVNKVTIPDSERTPPLHELLQRFHGTKFMTSLDLSKAFLQLPLKKSSRPYTAFLFDSTVYQYKRAPYGFRNSLSGFVRALKLALGNETSEFVVYYVDDILIHSEANRLVRKHYTECANSVEVYLHSSPLFLYPIFICQ
jgi:hypothetical protein